MGVIVWLCQVKFQEYKSLRERKYWWEAYGGLSRGWQLGLVNCFMVVVVGVRELFRFMHAHLVTPHHHHHSSLYQFRNLLTWRRPCWQALAVQFDKLLLYSLEQCISVRPGVIYIYIYIYRVSKQSHTSNVAFVHLYSFWTRKLSLSLAQ